MGKLLAQSNPAIQKQIKQVVALLRNQTSGDFHSNVAIFQEIQNLKNLTADESEIVKQIAIFAAASGSDERQLLMPDTVLHLLQLKPKNVIPALAPYLDSENKALRSFVQDWFQHHDSCGSSSSRFSSSNYYAYADYVMFQQNKAKHVPVAFIEYVYDRSPGRALMIFERASHYDDTVAKLQAMRESIGDTEQQQREVSHQALPLQLEVSREQPKQKMRKEILLAEHLVSSAIWLKKNEFDERFNKSALPVAKQQLEKLSRHEHWWARLYVAEIMRQHRELRLADVLERLRHDSNAQVSNSAKSVQG